MGLTALWSMVSAAAALTALVPPTEPPIRLDASTAEPTPDSLLRPLLSSSRPLIEGRRKEPRRSGDADEPRRTNEFGLLAEALRELRAGEAEEPRLCDTPPEKVREGDG